MTDQMFLFCSGPITPRESVPSLLDIVNSKHAPPDPERATLLLNPGPGAGSPTRGARHVPLGMGSIAQIQESRGDRKVARRPVLVSSGRPAGRPLALIIQ